MGTGEHAIGGRTATCWNVAVAGMGGPAAGAEKGSHCRGCYSDKTLAKTIAAGNEVRLFMHEARLAATARKTHTRASCHPALPSNHPDEVSPASARLSPWFFFGPGDAPPVAHRFRDRVLSGTLDLEAQHE